MLKSIQTAFLILFASLSIAQVDMVITKKLQGAETMDLQLKNVVIVEDAGAVDVVFKTQENIAKGFTFAKQSIKVVAYGTNFRRNSNIKINIVNPNVNKGERYKVDKFQLSYENPYLLNQFIVLEKENMPVNKGYELVKNWVNVVYNTPREVIKGDIKDEYVRIEGIEKDMCIVNGKGILSTLICSDIRYSFSFEFKNNKIKMQLISIKRRPQKDITGDPNYTFYEEEPSWNEIINQKTGEKIKYNSRRLELMANEFNILANSLKDYLEDPIESRNDDW